MAISHGETHFSDFQHHPTGFNSRDKGVGEEPQYPQFQDTEPLEDAFVLDSEETQLADLSDCEERRMGVCGFEDQIVLDSEDEEVNGSRIVSARSLSSNEKCAAGLSYIDSQEPEDSSQANALNFVEKLMSFNKDMGLSSPGVDRRKTTKVKSPPATNTKGSQSVARLINLGSESERTKTFEWVDLDDHVGFHFSNQKMGSQNEHGDCKERSDVARDKKVRHVDATKCISSGDGSKERGIIRNLHEEITKSEGKIENESASTSEEHFNATPAGLQPESSAIERNEVDMFDVGFDTQMAAEAMEALAYADHLDCNNAYVSGGVAESEAYLENPFLQKDVFPNRGGINGNVKRKKRSTRISRRAVATSQNQCKKREVDPDLAALTKVKRNRSFDVYCTESPKAIKQTKLDRAADGCKKYSSISHQTTSSMPGCKSKNIDNGSNNPEASMNNFVEDGISTYRRKKRSLSADSPKVISGTEDGSNSPGERMKSFVDNGILTYRRKKRCLIAHPSETIVETGRGIDEPVERNSDFKKNDIITYRRKKRTSAKECCSNVYGSSGGNSTRKTCGIKFGLWSHPKRKRTDGNVQRNSCRATVFNAPFPLVDKGGISHHDEGPESRYNIERKAQSSVCTVQPQLLLDSNSHRSLLELQSSKLDTTDPTLSGLKCTAPSDSTIGMKGSSINMSHDYHKNPCNKNFPKSSLLKELIGLGFPKPVPDFTCKNLRRRRNVAYVRVLFSQHLDDDILKQQKKIIARLGLSIASCSMDATHFVTDQFARTRNMLEFIALGKPVVTHLWLESCGEAKCLISEKSYILRDDKKEKEIGFSMLVSLECAKRCPLLKGRKVFITSNIKPGKEMITNLVKTVQGEPVEKIQIPAAKGEKIFEDLLIISCEEDQTLCLPFLVKGAAVYSSELLLNGIVTQRLEYKRHQLFTNLIKKVRF